MTRRSPSSTSRSPSTCRRSCPRWPDRSGPRTASPSPTCATRSARPSPTVSTPTPTARPTSTAPPTTANRRAPSTRPATESFPASDPPSYTRDPEAEQHASPDAPRHEPQAAAGRGALPGSRGAARRQDPQAADRLRRDRGHHVVHEHEQPDGHGRRGAARSQRGRPRPRDEAVGEDLARARVACRHRLPAGRRPDGPARAAALPPRRVWLHDLHRQLWAARRAGGGGDRGERHRRGGGPVGQPQLRGPDPPAGAGQLPRLAAAGRRLRARRADRHRPHHASRSGPTATASRSCSTRSGRRPTRSRRWS